MEKYLVECDPHESIDPMKLTAAVRNELVKEYAVRFGREHYTFETDREISTNTLVKLYNRGILLTHLGNGKKEN